MGLMVRESFTNETKGVMFGESDWVEAFTDDRKRLFRDCQKEYGRCVSSVYVDLNDGGVKAVGWYFEKRMEYEDARHADDYGYRYTQAEFRDRWTYIRGVWVHLAETVSIACSNCDHEWEGFPLSQCPDCGATVAAREVTESEKIAS